MIYDVRYVICNITVCSSSCVIKQAFCSFCSMRAASCNAWDLAQELECAFRTVRSEAGLLHLFWALVGSVPTAFGFVKNCHHVSGLALPGQAKAATSGTSSQYSIRTCRGTDEFYDRDGECSPTPEHRSRRVGRLCASRVKNRLRELSSTPHGLESSTQACAHPNQAMWLFGCPELWRRSRPIRVQASKPLAGTMCSPGRTIAKCFGGDFWLYCVLHLQVLLSVRLPPSTYFNRSRRS